MLPQWGPEKLTQQGKKAILYNKKEVISMKRYSPAQLVKLLAMPALTVILGLILLLSPDSASALVGKVLGWAILLGAAALGAGAFLGTPANRNNRIVWTVICFTAGVWILMNPLTIAKFLGRVLGLALMIRSGQSLAANIRYQGGKLVISQELVVPAVIAIVGAVLVILPMATTRVVFNLVGIVLICVGIAGGIDRLKGQKLLDEGEDPNIIDVEKV